MHRYTHTWMCALGLPSLSLSIKLFVCLSVHFVHMVTQEQEARLGMGLHQAQAARFRPNTLTHEARCGPWYARAGWSAAQQCCNGAATVLQPCCNGAAMLVQQCCHACAALLHHCSCTATSRTRAGGVGHSMIQVCLYCWRLLHQAIAWLAVQRHGACGSLSLSPEPGHGGHGPSRTRRKPRTGPGT